jgi:hypothetical protein
VELGYNVGFCISSLEVFFFLVGRGGCPLEEDLYITSSLGKLVSKFPAVYSYSSLWMFYNYFSLPG